MASKALVNSHDVVHFTRVSRVEAGTTIYVPSVALVAHSSSRVVSRDVVGPSRMRATVDIKRGEEMAVQTSLKLWGATGAGSNVIGGDWRLLAQGTFPNPNPDPNPNTNAHPNANHNPF